MSTGRFACARCCCFPHSHVISIPFIVECRFVLPVWNSTLALIWNSLISTEEYTDKFRRIMRIIYTRIAKTYIPGDILSKKQFWTPIKFARHFSFLIQHLSMLSISSYITGRKNTYTTSNCNWCIFPCITPNLASKQCI